MTINIQCFLFKAFFFDLGSLICKEVHQSPADVLCLPKKAVTLNCSHSISSYDTILWYQRAHGDTSLKLIGYARYSSTKDIEEEYRDNFNITGDGRSSASLHIKQARQVKDSAAYFCAAYYAQCYTWPDIRTKTLNDLFTCIFQYIC